MTKHSITTNHHHGRWYQLINLGDKASRKHQPLLIIPNKEGERAILDSSVLLWTDNVVHLGNYVNNACNDDVDCNIKNLSLLVMLINSWLIMGDYRQVF